MLIVVLLFIVTATLLALPVGWRLGGRGIVVFAGVASGAVIVWYIILYRQVMPEGEGTIILLFPMLMLIGVFCGLPLAYSVLAVLRKLPRQRGGVDAARDRPRPVS